MSFLYCDPCVFVIGNEYELLVLTEERGLISVNVGGVAYYESNSGALSSEKRHARIRVPKDELNSVGEYTVTYRRSIDRKAYYSVLGEPETKTYAFRPADRSDRLKMYLISDVHYNFELAKKTASYFGDDLDVLLVNGDIGEVETEENYREVAAFVSEITHGTVPAVFVRGNHDTRGRLAERYTDFFPANGCDTYFTFDLGAIRGIAFDCGEDKPDIQVEYGGVNAFEAFRRRETAFFKSLIRTDKPTFAIGHMCPAQITDHPGSVFDIEADVFARWVSELDRVGISFMLCGHFHRNYVLESGDKRSLIPHGFPVIVGTGCYFDKNDMWGTALTVENGHVRAEFTDSCHNVRETHILPLK